MSTRQAAVLVLSIAIQASFLSNPVFDVIAAGGMVADIINANGYSTTQTRESVDEYAKANVESIQAVMRNPELVAHLDSLLKQQSPGLSVAQRAEVIDEQTSLYKLKTFVPEGYERCFSQFTNPVNGQKSLSGEPLAGCDDAYVSSYFAYIENQRANYVSQQVTDGQHRMALTNGFLAVQAKSEIEIERKSYLTTLYIFMGILGLITIAVVAAWAAVR